ncbi:M20/M25/M40 family metallo-hydrolase [Halobacillus sp. ACCC02827]|uniref:M20/M25/M40 family metallo-hydrolase n=1 Tax=Bacillaceae TaxID=186817 RepID=UPI0002A4CF57|nr:MULTISPECIES: M20/M25/M40 family metallo-hydrolase [Bacillaceae]ELK44887.1 M20 family peptidase [Halobacillus sp. BAB-2008]QHT47080.1 M20/M25/M40 family metallo-hydrolase [Bacillus sp. SB49]WJE14308.1 M20/M25/M40 family metallo-hydrolase [Halobacillus sp. ACCC02827]
MTLWQTREQLTELLCSLVEYPSITNSNEEIAIIEYLYYILEDRNYYQNKPDHLKLHPLDDGRQLLTALVKKDEAADTIVLIAHVDVVGIEDYGSYQNLAFYPRELTQEFLKNIDDLPKEAARDLKTGNWLFGRGAMDMKAGLTVHLSLLEKAMAGEFDGNLLLVAVPDEEVNSEGMLAALPALAEIKEKENLNFKAALNGEPMFSKYPGDPAYYLYTGSIGKTLPGFLCYGKETHVGEPFGGLNANLMMSYLAQELELNEAFIENVGGERTPPPISLMQRDLKHEYSVQTPQAAVTMYNVLYMKQTIQELNEKLLQAAQRARAKIIHHYHHQASFYLKGTQTSSFQPDITILTYDQLYKEAVKRFGKAEVDRRQNRLVNLRDQGDRDFSTTLVQSLASICKDISPMIVLFYSPPFYPSVSSHDDPYIQHAAKTAMDYAREHYGEELEMVEYFTGLSDLSFIGPASTASSLQDLTKQMPIHGNGFEWPAEAMEMITMPILNVGPLGRDPHQWTERLELSYSFEKLPVILTHTIHELFRTQE